MSDSVEAVPPAVACDRSIGTRRTARIPHRSAGRGPKWNLRFFIWTACNPLKSPESDKGIQENPRLFSWFGLAWLWFGLEKFGLTRSADRVGRSRLSGAVRRSTTLARARKRGEDQAMRRSRGGLTSTIWAEAVGRAKMTWKYGTGISSTARAASISARSRLSAGSRSKSLDEWAHDRPKRRMRQSASWLAWPTMAPRLRVAFCPGLG